jgi:hypothetical protein
MAQLSKEPVGASDLEKFVSERSDFAFEMQVLRILRDAQFTCSHSGTYRDPVTEKIRQFDIRAVRVTGRMRLALAVECKNLQDNSPLLLSAVPRSASESFHHVLLTPLYGSRPATREMTADDAYYKAGQMVGKRTDQVGRDTTGRLVSDDQATFDKMNQAVNSCRDFVQKFGNEASPLMTVIVPVLVLPPNRLWQVEYDTDGHLKQNPAPQSRGTLFLDHSWSAGSERLVHLKYRISHLECLTSDGLKSWIASCFLYDGLFPKAP